MIGKTAQHGLTKATMWLLVASLSFPSLAPASCGCGESSGSDSDMSCCSADRTSSEGSKCGRCCQTSTTSNECCHEYGETTPSCCSRSDVSYSSDGGCKCGTNCTCGHAPVPEPPAVPANQEQTPREQIASAQLDLATSLPVDAAVNNATVVGEVFEFTGPTTSPERCSLLSRFTL